MAQYVCGITLCRFYSDYDSDAGLDAGGDVISIHDDDSEPESSDPPASKHARLSDDAAATAAPVTAPAGPETEAAGASSDVSGVELMMEYWQANSYSPVSLAASDTSDAEVMFARCPQLRNVACLVVDLKPSEMLYVPASWLYQVYLALNVSWICLLLAEHIINSYWLLLAHDAL